MADPDIWAGIAERVGIPFTIIIMFFCVGCVVVWWVAKYVVKPICNSLIDLVHSVKEVNVVNAETFKVIAGEVTQIKFLMMTNNVKLDELKQSHVNGKATDKVTKLKQQEYHE